MVTSVHDVREYICEVFVGRWNLIRMEGDFSYCWGVQNTPREGSWVGEVLKDLEDPSKESIINQVRLKILTLVMYERLKIGIPKLRLMRA
ncbi:hypothetical protein TNCV_59741 [Trichonephila clavipes]|nr:hypothetical protein TNCV_59741 [Trichonephila clavipes]